MMEQVAPENQMSNFSLCLCSALTYAAFFRRTATGKKTSDPQVDLYHTC